MRYKAKNRHERAIQVLRWLKTEFRIDRLKRIEWKPFLIDENGDQCHGWVVERGDDLIIQLSYKLCRTKSETIETVIHEAAHAYLWDKSLGYFHGDPYWIRFGRMRDAYDHHGWSDSQTFKVD